MNKNSELLFTEEQIFGNSQVKCTPHDRSSLYDSAAFVSCTDIFPFFIGQKCEQLKPVGIFLWKYCLKRNHFIVKIKTDVENSWFYWNKQTNTPANVKAKQLFLFGSWQLKAQTFLFVNWVEGQRFPFFQWMKPKSFCAKQNNLSLDYLWECKHLAVLIM